MQYLTKQSKRVIVRLLRKDDHGNLHAYLQGLSPETKLRFGPHSFDSAAIREFYSQHAHQGYVALEEGTNTIVAYVIVKMGYLEHDETRLHSYGLMLDHETDCTVAPSVADVWQGSGIGQAMITLIIDDLLALNKRKLILWGGVQADNEKAVRFYTKNEFQLLGEFFYNGRNYDMVRMLHQADYTK